MDWLGSLLSGIGDAIGNAFTSIWDTLTSSIWDLLIEWIYNAIYSAIADFFTLMGQMGAEFFDLPWIAACLRFFYLFGWGMFIAGLVVAVFDTAIEYQSMGRFNIKRQVMPFLYGFLAVNLFTTVPVRLYTFCITLQNTFSKELTGVFAGYMGSTTSVAEVALSAIQVLSGMPSIFNLLFLIALGYCVIKIFFANIKRGGILLTQIAVGSLYMFSIPKGYTDGFISWCKQVIALCLTAFLQMTLLFLGLMTWQTNLLLGLGVMLSANEVPRVAQSFGLDTSARVNVMSAVHTTTSFVNLTRAIAKK